MTTYRLFIDDERNPADVKWGYWQDQELYRDGEWLIARDWSEVLELVVSLGFPSVISFDHDLGDNTPFNGYQIAQKLCDMILDGVEVPENFYFLVHSKNPPGAANIKNYMTNFLKRYGE